MARYIDADKIDFSQLKDDFDRARAKIIIMGQPTVDVVEVKHGEWIKYPSDAYMKCSVCGMEYAKEKMPNIVGYCPNPNCGAKMDGGKAE
jgi:hypothetical protein